MSDTPSGSANKTAPYTSFKSMKTLIASLKEHGIPNRIDRSVLTSFSGTVGTQIMTALRFLELTEDGGRPTDSMKRLVEAHGSDDWGGELEGVLRTAYEPLFTIEPRDGVPKGVCGCLPGFLLGHRGSASEVRNVLSQCCA